MTGDFSRRSFDPAKGYTKVYLQQGRVQLDADWNDQTDINAHRMRILQRDLLGLEGAPLEHAGFSLVERGGLHFDGIDDLIEAGTDPGAFIKDLDPFTICCWVRPERKEQDPACLLSCYDQAGETGGWFLQIEPDGHISFQWVEQENGGNQAQRYLRGSVPARYDQLNHIAVCFDGTRTTIYLNAEPIAVSPRSAPLIAISKPLVMGARATTVGTDAYLAGDLCLVTLSDQALSRARIRLEMVGDPDPTINVAIWTFLEGKGDHVLEQVTDRRDWLGRGEADQKPSWLPRDIWIGPGRYYVAGLLCELPRVSRFSGQADLPGITLETALEEDGSYLAYLDAWEQMISPIEDPDLLEPALQGIETSVRARIVRQVRLCPLTQTATGSDPATVRAQMVALLNTQRPAGGMIARYVRGSRGLGNQLYRVEIHSSGVPWSYPRIGPDAEQSVEVTDISRSELRIELATNELMGEPWQPGQLIELFSTRTDLDKKPGPLATVIDVQDHALIVFPFPEGIDNLADKPRARRIAGFKWSRNNASRILPIESLDTSSMTITPGESPYWQDFTYGRCWVELGDDTSLLSDATTTLIQVEAQKNPPRFVAIQKWNQTIDPERHAFIRLWDQRGDDDSLRGGVVIEGSGPDAWQTIEHGLQVRFTEGYYRHGDFWEIPTRTLLENGLIWPRDSRGPSEVPARTRPRFQTPLALIEKRGEALSITDLRRFFGPMVAISERMRRISRDSGQEQQQGPVVGEEPGKGDEPARTDLVCLDRDPVPPSGFRFTGLTVKAEPWYRLPWPLPEHMTGSPVAMVAIEEDLLLFLDSGQLWRYRHETDTFTQCAPLPEPRTDFAACAWGGEIYVIGGRDIAGKLSRANEIYKPEENRWVRGDDLPRARSHLGLAVSEGRIYAIGGLRAGFFGLFRRATARVDVYDPMNDVWADAPPLKTARFGAGIACGTSEIYVAGGYRPSLFGFGRRETDRLEVFYQTTDAWVRADRLPRPCAHPALVVHDHELFLMGGTVRGMASSQHEILTIATESRRSGEPIPRATARPSLVPWNGRLILASGTRGLTELYQLTLDSRLYVHEPEQR